MTNIKGSPKRHLPDEVIILMRKQFYKQFRTPKEIHNYINDHWPISLSGVYRILNYETYKDVK